MATVLYRFYTDTGQLLYVGITMDPAKRFKSHRGKKDWWSDVAGITLEHYETRSELENAERRAIQVEHPLHNVVRAKPNPAPIHVREPEPVVEIPAPPSVFSKFFESRYGIVSEASLQKHVAEARARQEGRRGCGLCDESGYRGVIVCDHVDRSNAATEARRRISNILRRPTRASSGSEV